MRIRCSPAVVAAALACAGASQAYPPGAERDYFDESPPVARTAAARTAADAIAAWPATSRELAKSLMQEYGAPDGIAADQLAWLSRRPFSRIVAFRDPETPAAPNLLLQAVVYEVPVKRWRALSAFERGAVYDAVRGELVARTDSEETNYLALNLADEVVRGLRAPQDANAFYDKTLALSFEGKSSRYMRGLIFSPTR